MKTRMFIFIVFLSLLVTSTFAEEQQSQVFVGTTSILVDSYKTLRNQNVVKQQHDSSCGPASVATILRFVFGKQVTEEDVLEQVVKSMKITGQQLLQELNDSEDKQVVSEVLKRVQKTPQEVFSKEETERFLKELSEEKITPETLLTLMEKMIPALYNLESATKQFGYNVHSVNLRTVEELFEVVQKKGIPVIVQITHSFGVSHFTVVRGICEGDVYLADPSLGNIRKPISIFTEMWINKETQQGPAFSIFALKPEYDGRYWPKNHSLKLNKECYPPTLTE